MATLREPRIVTDVAEIAEKIRLARSCEKTLGRVVFLIGAGCSVSAGIPGAIDIAKRMVREVAYRFECCGVDTDSVRAYKSLITNNFFYSCSKGSQETEPINESIDWYRVYDEMFRRHYTAPDYGHDLFAEIVNDAQGAINWAHLCLGELVAQRFVSTILTTNFDQLVLSGIARAGVLPVVCDGLESLNRIDGKPRHPQLVELHGSRHTYTLRNAPDEVEAVGNNSQAAAAIQNLLHGATTFVAIGYGGREKGIINLLIQAGSDNPNKNLFWINY